MEDSRMAAQVLDKLRVGFVLDSLLQPKWIVKLAQEIAISSFSEIALICHTNVVRPNGRNLLWDLYEKLDARRPCYYADPLESVNIRAAAPDAISKKVVTCAGGRCDLSDLKSHNLDLLVDFSLEFDPALVDAARYGVWLCASSHTLNDRTAPPGFWEVMDAEPTTELNLIAFTSEAPGGVIIHRSWTSTDQLSVKSNRSKNYWKAGQDFLRKLRQLQEYGPEAIFDRNTDPLPVRFNGRRQGRPSNHDILSLLFKMCGRRLAIDLKNSFYNERWFLACSMSSVEGSPERLDNLRYLEPPKDRFWADPFPVYRNGKHYIFLEEYLYSSMKAHISVTELDAKGNWSEPVRVLECDYHLSYPFMLEWEDRLYMIPETKRNNGIELYRCVDFPTKWELEKVLISDVQAVDATLHQHNGSWWLFCNIGGAEFSSNDELHLFYADSPLGPWTPHKRNPVKSDVRSARPAGKLFSKNGNLYRPSQDCSIRMGGAISINKILVMDTERYEEVEVSRIDPQWATGLYGIHTINTAGKLTVVDCFGYVSKYS
jgi:hypothetical protein